MCKRGTLLLFMIATGSIVFVKNPKNLFPQVPVSRYIPTSDQIPAFTPSPSFEQIPAFTPSPSFEQIPAFTRSPSFEQIPAFTPSPSFEQMPAVELIPASEEVPASKHISAFEVIPVFEPVPVVEPPSASEEVPIEVLNTTNKTESARSWWRLPEVEQTFRWTSVPYIIFIFLLLLVMLQCLRGWYEKEQDWTQLPKNIQVGESTIQQLRDIVVLIQEAQDKHKAEVEAEMESMKEEMESRERYFTELQNVIDSMETRIKARDDHLARLAIQIRLMESLMEEEGKQYAQIEEEMHSLKMVEDGWVSMPMEQMEDDLVSMEHSSEDENA